MFYEAVGWERPFWYESNAPRVEKFGDDVMPRTAEWDARWWSPIINAEHLQMRETAGMIDLTPFAIFDIVGPGALNVVQTCAVRQMDVAVGKVIYTPVLTPRGGFRSDLTIMRLGANHFRVVTGGAHGMSDRKWIADHLPADSTAQLQDLTSSMTTLSVVRTPSIGVAHRRHVARGFPFTAALDEWDRQSSHRASPTSENSAGVVPAHGAGGSCGMVFEAGQSHGLIPVSVGVSARGPTREGLPRGAGGRRVQHRRSGHGAEEGQGR